MNWVDLPLRKLGRPSKVDVLTVLEFFFVNGCWFVPWDLPCFFLLATGRLCCLCSYTLTLLLIGTVPILCSILILDSTIATLVLLAHFCAWRSFTWDITLSIWAKRLDLSRQIRHLDGLMALRIVEIRWTFGCSKLRQLLLLCNRWLIVGRISLFRFTE